MKKIPKMFLWAALALFGSNCSDNQPVWPIDYLGARLIAYDEDGTERKKFEANTNITFGLSFTNSSSQDIEVAGSHCDVYQRDDFLLIYKLVQENGGKIKWMPYGRPYKEPLPCPMINLPLIVPARGEIKVAGATWNNVPDNPPFTAGNYYTAFSYDLVVDGDSRRLDLKLAFEVY